MSECNERVGSTDLLCDSCFYNSFHRAGSFYAVAEGGDDPYNYSYCAKGHWCGDINEDNSEQKEDPWRDCTDYRDRNINT